MNDHTPDTVGVDISKAHLDVHRRASGDSARFANDAAGFVPAPDSRRWRRGWETRRPGWSTSPRGRGTAPSRRRWPGGCVWLA